MKKNVSYKLILAITTIVILVIIQNGCKKTDNPEPTNPFSTIDYGTAPVVSNPDPNSLVGIHTTILQPKCAVPGCHDGNFEPDFRTPLSSYSTLVYHPVKKNDSAESFIFRVVPYQPLESVLYERITNCCFVNQDDRMPQDNIGVPLPDTDVQAIKNWIEAGAKDIFGNVPTYPNFEPNINPYYAVVDAATYQIAYHAQNNRIDSLPYKSFLLPDNTNIVFAFIVSDDSTDYPQLQVNQMKLSLDPDDFSNATTYTAQYTHVPPPNETDFFGITINTANLPHNQIVYMRYFVNDGDHINDTQFPTDNLQIEYKTYWSFYIN